MPLKPEMNPPHSLSLPVVEYPWAAYPISLTFDFLNYKYRTNNTHRLGGLEKQLNQDPWGLGLGIIIIKTP